MKKDSFSLVNDCCSRPYPFCQHVFTRLHYSSMSPARPQSTRWSSLTTQHTLVLTHHRAQAGPHSPQSTRWSSLTTEHTMVLTHHRAHAGPHSPQTTRWSSLTTEHTLVLTHHRAHAGPHSPSIEKTKTFGKHRWRQNLFRSIPKEEQLLGVQSLGVQLTTYG
ncbi:hypothetical protein BgiBS90_000875 [Biomphalaria glabrata]|nr:hypothetical protein BgiBS90_000875 [Biomphalaria glabrata]